MKETGREEISSRWLKRKDSHWDAIARCWWSRIGKYGSEHSHTSDSAEKRAEAAFVADVVDKDDSPHSLESDSERDSSSLALAHTHTVTGKKEFCAKEGCDVVQNLLTFLLLIRSSLSLLLRLRERKKKQQDDEDCSIAPPGADPGCHSHRVMCFVLSLSHSLRQRAHSCAHRMLTTAAAGSEKFG
jgi:hypothetical protein